MKSSVLTISVILWAVLGYFFYKSSKECCLTNSSSTKTVAAVATTAAAAPIVKKITGPILFKHSDANPILGDGWNAEKSKFTTLGNSEVLEITGYYDRSETNNTEFENLGLARAHETAKKFMPELSDDQIRKIGRERSGADKENLFVSTRFAKRIFSDKIKEIDGMTRIYFPFNSTKKLADQEVESYLDKVAAKVNADGGKVELVGHTDNIGKEEANKKLGQRRADIIKEYLVSKGLSADKVIAKSDGELSPVADNSTDEGRAKNRRTDLKIIK